MKIFLKFVLILFVFLIIVFTVWYSNVGSKKLYYIEEANMYIKIFPSRETAIIAFSDKKIEEKGYLLKYPYIEISFSLNGATEKVSLKNRENIYWTEIKPIY